MTYLYENTGSERFQQFCQALLIQEYPGLQCFPIGQPDGGRDALHRRSDTVLQVKFKRLDEEENADWMIDSLKGEKEKVERLAVEGAKSYVMVTNARPSGHPGGGRIDRVQQWMDENFPIESICFWRDDLDRRFESAPSSLKFAYAELLNGQDGIQLAIESSLGNSKQRQNRILKSFVAAQYEADRQVKFRQVSLSNSLLDLFIDVPISIPSSVFHRLEKEDPAAARVISAEAGAGALPVLPSIQEREILWRTRNSRSSPQLGAAKLLLSDVAQQHLRWIVMQGAPGQGKSTLAQYVCQVHRARYLNKADFLTTIEDAPARAFRLPIKIDLRDFDAYLNGSSPYGDQPNEGELSLEHFISQLMRKGAGGQTFNVDDSVDVLTSLPSLIFLDGLDEVADLGSRAKLVDAVVHSLRRLEEQNADLQVVVSSRPSLFGNAPDLSREGFVTLNLTSIGLSAIEEYTAKWVTARGLEAQEQSDVKMILKDKLDLSHIRELTRNPMQLTILLSLIHQVGYSLPDERTDLYKQYVDLFLTREAEKNPIVREYRTVLLEFIQHLAWILQRDAESSRSAGSISHEDLRLLLVDFLESAQHSQNIIEDLFHRGIERIFVLVERVEGLYEFEVQPLREYFCARHLYETAPVGTYRHASPQGDRAQRFEAMARNPFWTNVTRFYAGSYDRGELADLVSSIKSMILQEGIDAGLQVRRIGMALLSDWVFRARKHVQDDLVDIVFDDIGIELSLSALGEPDLPVRLDVDCGQERLRELLFQKVKEEPADVKATRLGILLSLNGGNLLSDDFIALIAETNGSARNEMLARMLRAGAASSLNADTLWDLMTEDKPSSRELYIRCLTALSHEEDIVLNCDEMAEQVIEGVLEGHGYLSAHSRNGIAMTVDILNPGVDPNSNMRNYVLRNIRILSELEEDTAQTQSELSARAFVRAVAESEAKLQDIENEKGRTVYYWNVIVESSRTLFGESWAAYSIALRCAGVSTQYERGRNASQMFAHEVPLCVRARHARYKRSGGKWWENQLSEATNDLERMFWAGVVLLWTSPLDFENCLPLLEDVLSGLHEDDFQRLYRTVKLVGRSETSRSDRKQLKGFNSPQASARLAALYVVAFDVDSSNAAFTPAQAKNDQVDKWLTESFDRRTFEKFSGWSPEGGKSNRLWLGRIAKIANRSMESFYNSVPRAASLKLPPSVAREVLAAIDKYPQLMCDTAVVAIERRYKPVPVARVASQEAWAFN